MRLGSKGSVGTGAGLKRYLSPFAVWALSFGCAVGWGSFVMPGTTFLPIAGPLGTTLGIAIGGLVMLVIGVNYYYLMNRYPDAGGTFTYAKHVFGYDHGFLSAWFLVLVYVAIAWANATALQLIFRNLLGGVFQFGFHYEVAGYDVYLGEVLLSVSAIVICGLVCMRGGHLASGVQILMACILICGVLVGVGGAVSKEGFSGVFHIQPSFMPGRNPAGSVFAIVALAPWAFVGFESISHSTEEFKFSPKKSFLVLFAAVVTGVVAYVGLTLLAASDVPTGYGSWVGYIRDIGQMSGLQGLPVFHAVQNDLGRVGLIILGITLMGGVITGLLGNMTAASRLVFSMARDKMLPDWFGRIGKSGTPKNAILFLVLVSIPIPFFGRTAIGWIVDVNTIGATIAYAYTSLAAFKAARESENTPILVACTGVVGAAISVLFFLYFLVPNFWTVSALTSESYLILIVWSILGFVYFRYIFKKDTARRFGRSTVVWIVLLFLIFFISMLWLRETTHDATETVLSNLSEYNEEELSRHGVVLNNVESADVEYYISRQMSEVSSSLTQNSVIQMVIIMAALFIMFALYTSMMRREREMEVQKVEAEMSNRAKSTFLSNMSHDIRTPMNAIIGYTGLAKKEEGIPPRTVEYLEKIEASSEHLLALINDVLEMSRIESGKMELDPVKSDIVKTMGEVHDLFATQMETKGLTYTVNTDDVRNRMVICDTNRLNRVLLNLISNAYKFTPEGGSVTVTLRQTGATEDTGSYELSVKDTGMGMSPEFAATVFDAYSRERTANNIQGTGLGMSITKSIVELMNGTIEVETEQGKGTEFIMHVEFPLAEETPEDAVSEIDGAALNDIDFSEIRLLLVEDNEINREIATIVLEEAGFQLETAENGQIAVDMIRDSAPGDFDAVLMDIQMPVMNGYDATRAIRKLHDKQIANIPIIAMTANAFSEDVQAAKDAGMNAHIAKPIDIAKMLETLTEVLR